MTITNKSNNTKDIDDSQRVANIINQVIGKRLTYKKTD